jgi:hypothetical protein
VVARFGAQGIFLAKINVGVKVLQVEVLYSSFLFFLKTQINYTSHPSKSLDTSTDTKALFGASQQCFSLTPVQHQPASSIFLSQ